MLTKWRYWDVIRTFSKICRFEVSSCCHHFLDPLNRWDGWALTQDVPVAPVYVFDRLLLDASASEKILALARESPVGRNTGGT